MLPIHVEKFFSAWRWKVEGAGELALHKADLVDFSGFIRKLVPVL